MASGGSMQRAKFVLGTEMVGRALGLGDGIRVVMLHVTRDPDCVHVTVEGEQLPVGGLVDAEWGRRAWEGKVEAPVLSWPQPAGPRTATGPSTARSCRVDESVGEADTAPAAPAGVMVDNAGAHAVGRAWEAAVEAVQLGVPAATVLHAVEDAVAEGLRAGQRGLRREVLEVVERLRSLLVEQDAADKDGSR